MVQKWWIWSRFLFGYVDRLLAEHPTPHPNWESRPGTPLVIFLGGGGWVGVGWGGGAHPIGGGSSSCTPDVQGPTFRSSGAGDSYRETDAVLVALAGFGTAVALRT